jgi:hypothetical protein
MNDQPLCTREDLRAIILIESSWGVHKSGVVDTGDHYGEGGGDTDYVDYYKCDNCEATFETSDGATFPLGKAAWEAALNHLEVREVA